MSAPRVMYNNLLASDNVTESSYVYPFDALGALNTLTYEYWRFDVDDAYIDVDLADSGTDTGMVDCLALVMYGLLGGTVTISTSYNGVTYTEIKEHTFLQDGAVMIYLDSPVSSLYFRLHFYKQAPGVAKIINVMLGQYLEFERCLMKSHAPAPYQRNNEFITNLSGNGQFIGRSLIKKGVESSINFDMITASWGRADFQRFVESAINKAYYLSWNPSEYPNEVVFGWTDEDIGISYTGDGALMSASWAFKGYAMDAKSQQTLSNAILMESGDSYILAESGEFILLEVA